MWSEFLSNMLSITVNLKLNIFLFNSDDSLCKLFRLYFSVIYKSLFLKVIQWWVIIDRIHSIHRPTLSKVLRSYGIPGKIVKLIKLFYEHFECSVNLPDGLSEGFEVRKGVRQGCILSPLLFLILIDFVLRQSTRIPRGIQWTLQSRLEDLDFADNLALLSYSEQRMQKNQCLSWRS